MAELATRYPCPVCLGVVMETLRIGGEQPLEIDHCGRCGGAWFDAGEVERLRTFPSAALWSRIARRDAEAVTSCHACHAPLSRGLDECPACGWKNRLDCPVCDRPMERREVSGVTVDACRRCHGMWLDHHELDVVWTAALIATAPAAGERARSVAAGAGEAALEMMWYAPGLTTHAAIGAAHAASHLPDVIAAAPEAAVHLAGAAGEAAGGIFEAIASIIAAIFEGLDF